MCVIENETKRCVCVCVCVGDRGVGLPFLKTNRRRYDGVGVALPEAGGVGCGCERPYAV